MALTISTGFVVDDAIVVIENITRYLEAGEHPGAGGACKGAREIGFTVLSMSTSLVAVFIPILLMGGIVAACSASSPSRLSIAIAVSLVVSLTTTPMMCAKFLQRTSRAASTAALYRFSERAFNWLLAQPTAARLRWVLRHPALTLAVMLATVGAHRLSLHHRAQGLLPAAGHGRLMGSIQAAQDISFPALRQKHEAVHRHRARRSRRWTTWWPSPAAAALHNTARMFITLKPLAQRKVSADQVIDRLRRKLGRDSRRHALSAGRAGPPHRRPPEPRAVSVHPAGRRTWSELNALGAAPAANAARPAGAARRHHRPAEQGPGSCTWPSTATPPRAWASTPQQIDNALYDAFGQRQVSTMYRQLNQYHVVMEVDSASSSRTRTRSRTLRALANGPLVPLSAFAHFETVQHLAGGQSPGTVPLGHAFLQPGARRVAGPGRARHSRRGARHALARQHPRQLLGHRRGLPGVAARRAAADPGRAVTVYIVLGMLYESYIHPITILSTLPSAGVGALLALLLHPHRAQRHRR